MDTALSVCFMAYPCPEFIDSAMPEQEVNREEVYKMKNGIGFFEKITSRYELPSKISFVDICKLPFFFTSELHAVHT